MRIEDLATSIPRQYPHRAGVATSREAGAPVVGISAVDRADQVSISDEARALANQDPQLAEAELPERLARIRERVLAGAYDSLETLELLSRRILATGEV